MNPQILDKAIRGVLIAIVVLILAFLAIPILIVVPLSFSDSSFMTFPPPGWSMRWYSSFFGSREWLDAAKTTMFVSAGAAVFATPFGVASAYALQHARHWSLKFVQTVLMLPLMVPAIIVSVGVFFAFTKVGMVNTISGLILANAMMGLPYVLITVGADLRTFDSSQELVARSLGMGRFRAFLIVTLPQIKPSVFSAAIFVFIQALDETVIALFVSGGAEQTLTRRMFVTLRDQIDPTIAAISTMLTAITLCLVMVVGITRRSAGRQTQS